MPEYLGSRLRSLIKFLEVGPILLQLFFFPCSSQNLSLVPFVLKFHDYMPCYCCCFFLSSYTVSPFNLEKYLLSQRNFLELLLWFISPFHFPCVLTLKFILFTYMLDFLTDPMILLSFISLLHLFIFLFHIMGDFCNFSFLSSYWVFHFWYLIFNF